MSIGDNSFKNIFFIKPFLKRQQQKHKNSGKFDVVLFLRN